MLKDTLLKSGYQVLVLRIIGVAFVTVLTWLMTKLYGATKYGDFVAFSMCVQILSMLAVLGLDQYLLRELSRDSTKNKLIGWSLLVCLLSSILWTGIFYLLNGYIQFLDPSLVKMLGLSTFMLGLIRIIAESLRSKGKGLLHTTLSQFLLPLFSIILLLIFYYLLDELSTVSLEQIYYLSLIIVGLSAGILLAIYLPHRPKLWPSSSGQIIQQSLPFLWLGSMLLVNEWADKICLKTMRDSYELGQYSLANRLSQFIAFPLMAFNIGLAPKVSNYFNNSDIASLRSTVRKISRPAFLLALGILAFLLLFDDFILNFFGHEFIEAKMVLLILGIAQAVNVFFGPVGVLMKMTDGVKMFQYIILIALLANVVLNIVLIPNYGINGAAMATLVSICLINGMAALWIKKKLGFFSLAIGKWND